MPVCGLKKPDVQFVIRKLNANIPRITQCHMSVICGDESLLGLALQPALDCRSEFSHGDHKARSHYATVSIIAFEEVQPCATMRFEQS